MRKSPSGRWPQPDDSHMRKSPSGRGPKPDDSQLDGSSDRPSNGTFDVPINRPSNETLVGPSNGTFDGPIDMPSNGTFDGPIDRPSNGTLNPGDRDGDRGDGKGKASKGIHAEFLNMKAYYLKYEYREQDMIWGVSMILICILLIAICMSLNMHVFRFYRKKFKQDVVSLLYVMMSLADILVATGSFVTVICLILYLTMDLEEKDMDFVYPSVKYLCYISFFISSIAIRVSIFLNALLSIVRTIMIKNPFYETSKRGICLAVAFVTLFWIITAAAEVYTQKYINIEAHWTTFETEISELELEEGYLNNRKQYLYLWYYIYTSAAGFYCTLEFLGSNLPWSVGFYDVMGDVDGDDLKQLYSENFALYGMFLIAFVIPCLISIVCLIIKAVILSRPSVGGTQNNNKVVTNTIMMLTLVFVICNTINIIVISLAMFYGNWFELDESGIEKDDDVIMRFYRTMFAVQQVLPLLNSTLSPMILIWRGAALRKSFAETFHKVLPSRGGGTKTITSSVRATVMTTADL